MFSNFVDISWSTWIFQFEVRYILISSTVVRTRFTFGKLIILYYQTRVHTALTKTSSTSPSSSNDAILVTDSCTTTDHIDKLRNSMILGALILSRDRSATYGRSAELTYQTRKENVWCMWDRASFMKMTRGTNLMQQLWFIIINISTCFGHLYAHLQEYRLDLTAYGVQH